MLVGREAERTAIGALLDGARDSRGGALVMRGEPGIGKTALLEDARQQASDMLVLAARGIESESDLPFATLHQLVGPSLDRLDQLPAPQAAALQGALGLGESAADERFLVSVACLSLLSDLAERQPLLCILDDAHWLDSASADVLLFVARRLAVERIVMLFAAREGEVRAFEAPDVSSLTLIGLDVVAAEELLHGVAGETAPSVRDHLVEQTRGNALALIELPSALTPAQLAGREPLPEALPLTHQVERVFLERVRRLPDETQRLLLVAAADDSADAAVVMRAADVAGSAELALDGAERAGLISVEGGRLEFRHPLVRSAVYGAATFTERREAHHALARALEHDDMHVDRRAWHLAASTLEPDEAVVQALEDVARRAAGRGGHLAAAKALSRAAELSADRSERGRRLVSATRAARMAAADEYAVMLANQARPLVDDPLHRAEIACAIGAAEVRRGRPLEGFPALIEAARDVAPLDLDKAVEVLVWANAAAFEVGNLAAHAEVSKTANTIMALGVAEESTYVLHALSAFTRALEGRSTGADELDEAFVWASTHDDAERVFLVGLALALSGDDERFAVLNDRAVSRARAQGDFGTLAQALSIRALRRAMQHRFDAAAVGAQESLRVARELGAVNLAGTSLFVLGYVAAIRGDDDAARRQAGEALEIFSVHGLAPRVALALYALAMLDLGRGRWAESLERLQAIVNPHAEGHPLLSKWALPDVVEAAVRAGRHDEAGDALGAFEEWLRDTGGPAWAHARATACRALVTKGEESTAHFEEAIQLGSDERPFDLARMQLLYGEHLRRERRRTDARVQLRAALDGFEHLRAEPWGERARMELRASGEAARKRDPSTIDQLTPQERQIAGFVADGLSNKEVAALLFLSPRTIDYHLRHVFAKLGITSRTKLARLDLGNEMESVASHASRRSPQGPQLARDGAPGR